MGRMKGGGVEEAKACSPPSSGCPSSPSSSESTRLSASRSLFCFRKFAIIPRCSSSWRPSSFLGSAFTFFCAREYSRMWSSLPLYRVPVHTNHRFLPLPVVITLTRNSSAASISSSFTRSHITLSSPPAMTNVRTKACVNTRLLVERRRLASSAYIMPPSTRRSKPSDGFKGQSVLS